MNAQEIRKKYLDFMKERGHEIIDRAPLKLDNDPTTLFTGSGMQPLLPYLLGEKHPKGDRLTDSQTCFRSQDIDDIGDNRHTTFFEMLGNWSLGDYFKEQQIEWFFEFLTDIVGLDPNKIYVTCFMGDEKYGIDRDDEAAQIWQKLFAKKGIDAKVVELGSAENGDKLGMQGGRIFFYDDKENWWSRGGGIETTPLGDPCGPDSEVFYDFGDAAHDSSYGQAHPASDSGRFMEIGNQVFMQYQRLNDGSFEPLEKKNVDFGGGLERIAAAAIESPDVFKVSVLKPIIDRLETLSGKKYESHTQSMRVIADHLRAASFLAVDGVAPSNKEQGYVMRRLLRRAIRQAFDLGIEQNFFEQIAPIFVDIYKNDFSEVEAKSADILQILTKEEKVFRQTLRKGLKEFEKIVKQENGQLTGADIFKLYDTFGFPVELSTEEAYRQNIKLGSDWRSEFDQCMLEQKQRSQTATKGKFKGGLEGQSEEHKRLHTATHLLNSALHDMFGEAIVQKGSNINEERLRFDFTFDRKIERAELDKLEEFVNQAIEKDYNVWFEEFDTEYALNGLKAIGAFGDKYSDKVTVYFIGSNRDNLISAEICGGPHVSRTSQIKTGNKRFKIKKEQSSSAGVRRIKAILC